MSIMFEFNILVKRNRMKSDGPTELVENAKQDQRNVEIIWRPYVFHAYFDSQQDC